jgi:hypothetical protein
MVYETEILSTQQDLTEICQQGKETGTQGRANITTCTL